MRLLVVMVVVWVAAVYLCRAQEEYSLDHYTCDEDDPHCLEIISFMQNQSIHDDDMDGELHDMNDEMFDEMDDMSDEMSDDHHVMTDLVAEEEDDHLTTTKISRTQSTDSTSTPSPTGPPISHLTRHDLQDDANTTTDDDVAAVTTTTDTDSSILPTGPPVVHLARQGPQRGVGRRPEYGPFPTPLRKPSVIGVIGFTVRRAAVGRARTVLSFKKIVSNTGRCWNQEYSYFRTPMRATFYFSFHAVSARTKGFKLALTVRGNPQVYAYASKGYKQGDCSAFLRLRARDRVQLELLEGAIYEPAGNKSYTTFTGIIVGIDLRRS